MSCFFHTSNHKLFCLDMCIYWKLYGYKFLVAKTPNVITKWLLVACKCYKLIGYKW
jgi:hypothetical protein